MILIAFSSICAVLYGFKYTHNPISLTRTIVKTCATLGLCLAGLLLGAPWVVLVGLLFGALGDAFLSRDHAVGFLPGLAAFLCGHLIYLFWGVAQTNLTAPTTLQIIASILLLISGAFFVKRWWSALGALKLPVLLYAIISMCLGVVALGMLGQGIGTLFAIGVLVFVLSDIILAEQLFMLRADDAKYPLYASLLWALYWVGQLGILLGSLSFVS